MIGSSAEPPVRDSTDRGDELLHVADPVLQQIADALGRIGEERQRKPDLHVLGENEDSHRRMSLADLERGLEALVVVRRRQSNVDDRHVG